jgi:hypothetical protein
MILVMMENLNKKYKNQEWFGEWLTVVKIINNYYIR